MEQIHMSNPVKVTSGGSSGSKGEQSLGVGVSELSQMGQGMQSATNFKGLLQGKQMLVGLTKEQEQTIAALAAGMQNINALMSAGMQDGEPEGLAQGEALEGVPNLQMMKPLQWNLKQTQVGLETAVGGTGQIQTDNFGDDRIFQAEDTNLVEAVGKETEGKLAVENALEEGTDTLLDTSENNAEQMAQTGMDHIDMAWQDMTVKQHATFGKTEQAGAHEHVKVATPQEIPQKLAEKIAEKSAKGTQAFEIQIEPENLGKIAVKIEYHGGESTISIICSESRTLEIVKQNISDISTVLQRNLQEETVILIDEKKAEAFEQQGNGNSDAGRESEWEREKEERKRRARSNSNRFLQELRLGLIE